MYLKQDKMQITCSRSCKNGCYNIERQQFEICGDGRGRTQDAEQE